MAVKLKPVPSIDSEIFFSDISKLPVVTPVVFSVVIPVFISVVISETFISVVSWSVVLLYVVSDIGTVTSFVYNQIQQMHTKQKQKTTKQ